MSSAFNRIYRLLKQTERAALEDYLTEIVAPIFEQDEILARFLERFAGLKISRLSHIKVHTQRTYHKLEYHLSDSRPDLVITFNHGSARHVVFIENKLGSGEGYLQLERYRDHLTLHKLSGFAVHLFYITQYYDPKNMDSVKDHFQQLQWFEVFHWLQEEYREDLYCKQILKYMEEIGLDKTRTFLPQDVYAVQNLWKTLSMLDECLDGKTAHCFTNLFGKPKQLGTRVTQLRSWNRYVIYNDQSDWKFVGCGFWMEHENYPEVSVFMEVGASSKNKIVLLKAFEAFEKEHENRILHGPEDENDGFVLSADKLLTHFLAEKDHIDAIQEFFIEKLRELNSLKQSLLELKWIVNEKETGLVEDGVET